MDEQGDTASSRRRSRLDPHQAARWVRRLTWAIAGAALLLFVACFGTQRVPAGMDSMPEYRAGSLCIVDKRKSAVRIGSAVFVDVPQGGTVLSRVAALDGDTVTVMHDNLASRLPDSRTLGALPRRAVRGTVLVVFAPDPPGTDGK